MFNKGVIPSGGQSYDIYLRGGTEYPSQSQIGNNVSFLNGNELSLTQFIIIGFASKDAINASLYLDDLYQFPGVNLAGPRDAFGNASQTLNDSNLSINFPTEGSKAYQIEGSDDLDVWFPIATAISDAADLPIIDDITALFRRF